MPTTRTSRLAVASLIFGVLSLVTLLLASIPGLACGILGLNRISESEAAGTSPRLTGTGFAVAGIVLSAVTSLSIPFFVVLLLPAVESVQAAASREVERQVAISNLKQASVAMLTAESAGKALPLAIVNDEGKRLLSWRVAVLPFLGDDDAMRLFEDFHLDEPWDSPHNSRLLQRMPDVFASPGVDRSLGLTRLLAVASPGAVFGEVDDSMGLGEAVGSSVVGVRLSCLRDGPANTAMLMSLPGRGVPWSKPSEWDGDPVTLFAEASKSGVPFIVVAMADGSVRRVRTDGAPRTVRAIFTSEAGDAVVLDD